MGVKVVANAASPQTVAIAPTARSVAALLAAIGVPDDQQDAVVEILSDEELFPAESVPRSYLEIMQQVRQAWAIQQRRAISEAGTIDAQSTEGAAVTF